MCLYFIRNVEFATKRQSHKKFRLLLVYDLVKPLLDKREEELEGPSLAKASENPRSRRSVSSAKRLVGKHYSKKMSVRRKCSLCAYKKLPGTNKRKNARTFDFCEKCDRYLCHNCFKDFHTKAKI